MGTVTKIVVALCMFTSQSGDMPEEHLLVEEGFGKCLEMKRKAERNVNPERIRFHLLINMKQLLRVDQTGKEHINKIIMDKT